MTLNTFDNTSKTGTDFLEHYGVKGMKWGVRRDLKKLPTKKARESYISEKDAKWKAKTEDPKRAVRAAKRASRDATRMTKKLNKKYKEMGYKLKGNSLRKNNLNNRKNRLARSQYDSELRGVLESSLDSAAYKVYKNSPSRLYQVDLNRGLDGTISAKVVPRQNAKLDKQRAAITNKTRKLKHSDDGVRDLAIKLVEDEDGFVIDIQLPEFDLELAEAEATMEHTEINELGADFLAHYGVKGMKWGKTKAEDPKTETKSKSASKYGTYTTNADGSREVYVGGVGSAGKYLTEDEQAEADKLWTELEGLDREADDAWGEFMELALQFEELEKNASRSTIVKTTPGQARALKEQREKVLKVGEKYDAAEAKYTTANERVETLRNKAVSAENQYYKDNPGVPRQARTMPGPGKTTYTSKQDTEWDSEARFKRGRAKHSLTSDQTSEYLEHYGVKGMKWGVRKDGKPQGYQGGGGSSKSNSTAKKIKGRVKEAVSEATDPGKRAKRKLDRSRKKLEIQRTLEEASAYERAAKESKQNTRTNSDAVESKTAEISKKTAPSQSMSKKLPSANSLSDEQLSSINKRFEMEKKYAAFVEERRPKSTGEKVTKFLTKAGQEAAANVTKQLMTKALGTAVMKATSAAVGSAGQAATKPTPQKTEQPKSKSNPPQTQPKPTQPTPPKSVKPDLPKLNLDTTTRTLESKPTTLNLSKAPTYQSILTKSYSEMNASRPGNRGTSWLDGFDTNRDYLTLMDDRRNRR